MGTALLLGFFATLVLGNLAIYLYTGNGKCKWFVLSNLTFFQFRRLQLSASPCDQKPSDDHHDGRHGGSGHCRHDGQDVF